MQVYNKDSDVLRSAKAQRTKITTSPHRMNLPLCTGYVDG